VHDHESIVAGRHYPNLRRVFRHLSFDTSFLSPDQVFHTQVGRAFSAWLNRDKGNTLGDRSTAIRGDLTSWTEKLRIDLNYTHPGLAGELTLKKKNRDNHLSGVCAGWQNQADFSFNGTCENETAELGRSILNQYAKYLARFHMASIGQASVDEIAFPPLEVTLVQRLQSMGREAGLDIPGQLRKIQEFFGSADFSKIPFTRIWGQFWATLARCVRNGMKPESFPSGSIYNDLEALAAYSPYCDAMFMDEEVDHYSRQGQLRNTLEPGAKVFSLRSKEAFLAYLKDLENEATADHLELVRQVYGPNAGSPFLSLLTWDKKRAQS